MKTLIYILCLAIMFSPYSYLQAQVSNSDTPYNEIIIHLEDLEEQALVLRKVIEGKNINVSERVNDIKQLREALYNYLTNQANITVEGLISFFHQRGYEMTIINDSNPNYLDPERENGKAIVGYILLSIGGLGVIITSTLGGPIGVTVAFAVVASIGFGSLIGSTDIDQDGYSHFHLWDDDEQDRVLALIEYWKERIGLDELDLISVFNIDLQ